MPGAAEVTSDPERAMAVPEKEGRNPRLVVVASRHERSEASGIGLVKLNPTDLVDLVAKKRSKYRCKTSCIK